MLKQTLNDPYVLGFIIVGSLFTLLEWRFAYRKELKSRTQKITDFFYQCLNYKLVGPFIEIAVVWSLSGISFSEFQLGRSFWIAWPLWLRFLFFLLLIDFLEYLVHNLLHRVPLLWEFHKIHHAIDKLDWWGNLHFHPIEIAVYKFCLYLPLFYLQPLFPPQWMLSLVMFRLAIGTMAHANLKIDLGLLNYIINTPTLHRWHHAHGKEAINKNLGVTFTVWDFIFGTALYPKDQIYPAQGLGFPGSSNYATFIKQCSLPFLRLFKRP